MPVVCRGGEVEQVEGCGRALAGVAVLCELIMQVNVWSTCGEGGMRGINRRNQVVQWGVRRGTEGGGGAAGDVRMPELMTTTGVPEPESRYAILAPSTETHFVSCVTGGGVRRRGREW